MIEEIGIGKRNLALICIGLTILALIPRFYKLDGVCFTSDEPVWMFIGVYNINKFLHHQFKYIGALHYDEHPHPNILVSMLSGFSYLALGKEASKSSLDLFEMTAAARLPIVLLGTVSIPLAFLLFYRVSNVTLAFLAALFLALSPFHIALSRINIGDAALTLFIMISILSFYLGEKEKRVSLKIASCLFFTFALLTKTVLALTALIIRSLWKILDQYLQGQFKTKRRALFYAIFEDIGWILLSLALFIMLYPKMWGHPLINLINHLRLQISVGTTGWANFFLGESTSSPPFYFYLMTIPLRMNEILLVCFITGMIVMITSSIYRHRLDSLYLLLFLWLLICGGILSVAKTKFDRYALIMWPAICFIGAIGCLEFTKMIIKSLANKVKMDSFLVVVAAGIILIFSLPALISFSPNYSLYYNSIIGGPNGAKDKLMVGMGEGLREALLFIPKIDNGRDISIAVLGYTYVASLYSKAKIISANDQEEWRKADYLVVQLITRCRSKENLAVIYSLTHIPIYTVILNNVEVVWVYKLKKYAGLPVRRF